MREIPELERISDYVEHYAREDPDQLALVSATERWTYARFAAETDRYARSLLRAGIEKGDRVALMGTPRPEVFLGCMAAASIGAITLGLNPKFPLEELRYFVDDAEPAMILGFSRDAEGEHRGVLRLLGAGQASVRRTVIFADEELEESCGGESMTSWRAWLAEGDAIDDARRETARQAVRSNDAALIVYTSGSTGRPKGAVLPHRGLVRCSMVQAEQWQVEPLKLLVNLPVNHIGYMGDMCASMLVGGGTVYFMEKFDPPGMLRLIQDERITCWGQVPTMFQLTLALPDFSAFDLSSLQLVVWGGASAPLDIIEALRSTGARVATSYGMTETTGSVTYTAPDADLDELAETVGRPHPAYEVRIARPDGSPVEVGETGEIQVRGDHLLLEYWRRPAATAERFDAEGWFHTEDVAELRADGTYALRGRLSQMYKSGGENVYPREVEDVLERHGAVAMAAVLGMPDPVYSEVGYAWVIRMPGSDPAEKELRDFCRRHLANFKVPKRIFVRDDLPMLPVGKIDKVALRRRASVEQGEST